MTGKCGGAMLAHATQGVLDFPDTAPDSQTAKEPATEALRGQEPCPAARRLVPACRCGGDVIGHVHPERAP